MTAEEALNHLAEAKTLAEPLIRQDPNDQIAQWSLWRSLWLETETLLARRAISQALEVIPRMLAVVEPLAKSDLKDQAAQHDLAVSQVTRATALTQGQRWPEALEAFQIALSIDTELAGNSPGNGEYAYSCGMTRSNVGRMRFNLGQLTQAEADAQAAQDLLRTAAELDPDSLIPRQELVRVCDLRGDLCERQARPDEARQWFQRALQDLRAQTSKNAILYKADDWTALREKLTAKTAASAVTLTPAP